MVLECPLTKISSLTALHLFQVCTWDRKADACSVASTETAVSAWVE